jgi:hypothetical protein
LLAISYIRIGFLEYVLGGNCLDEFPAGLGGNKAYDSGKLDARLAQENAIELIAPNPHNRSKIQGWRKLCRYCRSWRVERLFAWIHNSRRLVARWDYYIENCLAFVQLVCLHMLLWPAYLSPRIKTT